VLWKIGPAKIEPARTGAGARRRHRCAVRACRGHRGRASAWRERRHWPGFHRGKIFALRPATGRTAKSSRPAVRAGGSRHRAGRRAP